MFEDDRDDYDFDIEPTLYDESDDDDREYHRALESENDYTDFFENIDGLDSLDCGYDLDDPKHPTYHDRYSDLEDIPF